MLICLPYMCTQSRMVIRARRDVYGSVERTSVYKRENMIDYKFSDFAVNSIYGVYLNNETWNRIPESIWSNESFSLTLSINEAKSKYDNIEKIV